MPRKCVSEMAIGFPYCHLIQVYNGCRCGCIQIYTGVSKHQELYSGQLQEGPPIYRNSPLYLPGVSANTDSSPHQLGIATVKPSSFSCAVDEENSTCGCFNELGILFMCVLTATALPFRSMLRPLTFGNSQLFQLTHQDNQCMLPVLPRIPRSHGAVLRQAGQPQWG